MDILMSLHKIWVDKILDGTKILEFRKSIGKDFNIGSTVYIYETAKNGGLQKVVGQFTIKDIVKLDGKSKVATFDLLPYYCKNVIKENDTLSVVNKAFSIELPNYNNSIKLSYIYNINFLESLRDTGSFPDLLKMSELEIKQYYSNQEKSKSLVSACDKWLTDIGFYNEYGESNYKYYIEIKDVVKFKKPLILTCFIGRNGKVIERAPQSWCYCNYLKNSF